MNEIEKALMEAINNRQSNATTGYEMLNSLIPKKQTVEEYQKTAAEELRPFLGSRAADREYDQSQILFNLSKNLFDYGSTGQFGPAASNFIGNVGAISKAAIDAEKQRKLAIGTRAMALRDADKKAEADIRTKIASIRATASGADKVSQNVRFSYPEVDETTKKPTGRYVSELLTVDRKDRPAMEQALNEKYKDVGGITPLTVVPSSYEPSQVTVVNPNTGERRTFPDLNTFNAIKNKYAKGDDFLLNARILKDSSGAGDYDAQETRMLRELFIDKDKDKDKDISGVKTRYLNTVSSEINPGKVSPEEGNFGIATFPTFPDNDYGVNNRDLKIIEQGLLSNKIQASEIDLPVLNALRNKNPNNNKLTGIIDDRRKQILGDDFDYVAGGELFKLRAISDAGDLPAMISSENLKRLKTLTGVSAPLTAAWSSFQAFIENEPSNPKARALLRAIEFGNVIANSQARELFGFDNQKLTQQIIELSKVLDIQTGANVAITDVKAQAESIVQLIDNQLSIAEKNIDRAYNNTIASSQGVKARDKILGLTPYRQVLLDVLTSIESIQQKDFSDILSTASREAGYSSGWSEVNK